MWRTIAKIVLYVTIVIGICGSIAAAIFVTIFSVAFLDAIRIDATTITLLSIFQLIFIGVGGSIATIVVSSGLGLIIEIADNIAKIKENTKIAEPVSIEEEKTEQ